MEEEERSGERPVSHYLGVSPLDGGTRLRLWHREPQQSLDWPQASRGSAN